MGMASAIFFHAVGIIPFHIDSLQLEDTGAARIGLYSFNIQFGIPSGSGDLDTRMRDNFLLINFSFTNNIFR